MKLFIIIFIEIQTCLGSSGVEHRFEAPSVEGSIPSPDTKIRV